MVLIYLVGSIKMSPWGFILLIRYISIKTKGEKTMKAVERRLAMKIAKKAINALMALILNFLMGLVLPLPIRIIILITLFNIKKLVLKRVKMEVVKRIA